MISRARQAAFTLMAITLASRSGFVLGFSSSAQVTSSSQRKFGGTDGSVVLPSTASPVDAPAETVLAENTVSADDLATQLLSKCADYGQIGSKLTDDQRAEIDELCSAISAYTDPAPAQIGLEGTHELIYSASPGGSSGAVGPFVGDVTQSFLDGERFINRVELFGGIVKVELHAERKALDENRIRVTFKETAFSLFNNEVKRGEAKGRGVWDYMFSGTVNVDGETMLLRVMKTPSTFVIVQRY